MKKNKLIIVAVAAILASAALYSLYPQTDAVAASAVSAAEDHSGEGDDHSEGDKDHDHSKGEENHDHSQGNNGQDHEESEGAEISEIAGKNAGLVVEKSGPANIRETVSLTGRVALNQNKTALIRARFPGIIRSVKFAQGDSVSVGAILATVESNDSLQTYPVTSPITGTILNRNANVGDSAADESLFTIADLSELWVEVHVFAQDAGRVRAGQTVTITSGECDQKQETTISALLPITETSSQTLLARATVKNLDTHWLPGMSISAEAVISSKDANVAVRTAALQRVENRSVVFVREGGKYHARPVEIGLSDDAWTEIKSGMEPGEEYVSTGSFTVKAELSKSEAEHSH